MAWYNEIPIMVRTLINDLSDCPTYSDERLLQVITVAAKYVQFDIDLDVAYTVDVLAPNIIPDPTDQNDSVFITFVSLKTACIIDQSMLRTKAAMEGIKAALGPAQLSVAGSLAGVKMLLDQGPCATYDELTSHWNVQEATAIRAILSPFVGNRFDPSILNTYHNPRARTFYT